MEAVSKQLKKLADKLKPALEKTGEYIERFGHVIQDAIESFSSSLDAIQKNL